MSEESNANGGQPGESVGSLLRKARIEADLDVNKICADLRISPKALEALEEGDYRQLPGDPYIRALLGSLGRYLRLDSAALVQRYNREIGAVSAEPSIAPYKDRSSTHTASHKQLFIVIFAALIVVLIVLINQLRKIDPASAGLPPAPEAAPADADSLAETPDTAVSSALAPDSADSHGTADSGEARGSEIPAPKPMAGTPAAEAAPAPAPPAELTSAIVKPLVDSVGVRVARSGKEDFATLLRLGKQMQVSHTDTIVVFVTKRRSVEVTVDGQTVIPDRKRFKIFRNTVKAF
jgi:cytoskeletal protein RodZ